MVDPVLAITAQIGVLTAASLLWTLQSLLVWKAVDRTEISARLGRFLQTMTALATVSVAAALGGTLAIALNAHPGWILTLLIGSTVLTFALLVWIFLYYLALVGALLDGGRAA